MHSIILTALLRRIKAVHGFATHMVNQFQSQSILPLGNASLAYSLFLLADSVKLLIEGSGHLIRHCLVERAVSSLCNPNIVYSNGGGSGRKGGLSGLRDLQDSSRLHLRYIRDFECSEEAAM